MSLPSGLVLGILITTAAPLFFGVLAFKEEEKGGLEMYSLVAVNDALHIQEANLWNGSSTQKSVEEGDKFNKSGWHVHSTKKGVRKGHSSHTNGSSFQKKQVAKVWYGTI